MIFLNLLISSLLVFCTLANAAKIQRTSGGQNRRFSPYPKRSPNFAPTGGWKPGTSPSQKFPVYSVGKPGQKKPWETRHVNSDGANDNCAYCTVAGVKGSSVDKIIQKSGGPMYTDQQFVKTPQDIQRIAQQGGFPNTKFTTVDDFRDLNKVVDKKLRPGQTKTFGLSYPHTNGNGGHVVALKAWKPNVPNAAPQHRVIDFQKEPRNRFSTNPDGLMYHLYDFGKKQ